MNEILGGQHCITAGRKFRDDAMFQRTNATAFYAGMNDPAATTIMAKAVQDQPNQRDVDDDYSEHGQ